ncbi:lysophospholipid acyltransferase family protein [Smaragdicoccus niigatensis]|uniref:lysophospholipid acyltransferase family protein n=1 Tax=Smaragdicoccus niigatensis TaxID=359359 RepID=UPI000475601C|nr:lysophospholipid acyltransferase family protein [Smaragdicoccus niigatensis]
MAKRQDSSYVVPPAPSPEALAPFVSALAPLRRIIKPKLYGIENVPERGALLVGNHTLWGVFDLALLGPEFIDRKIVVRGLADHFHFKVPLHRDAITAMGAVPGTRDNVRELMRRGDNILVFPGGAREVAKRKGEKYQLIWKNRIGFALMAIEGRYPIIPFASLGIEDALDIVLDTENPVLAPARIFAKKFLDAEALPIVRGVGPLPIPRPDRLYFWFGEPISTLEYDGVANEESARDLRARTAAAIEGGLDFLQAEREHDPERSLLRRILGSGSEA